MSKTGGGQCFNGILGCRCQGAMLMFGQHYVRTGIFTAEDSKLYSNLQMMREESDYNCVYVTTAEEMQPLFEPVREFLAKIGNLIKE